MDEKLINKIIIINLTTFFFLWNIIFLAGADKPPPTGFLWLVFLVILLDICQYFYLKRFLPRLMKKSKGLFLMNLFYFLLGGIIVSLLTLIISIDITLGARVLDVLFWTGAVLFASLINAVFFYVFNMILLKKYNQI